MHPFLQAQLAALHSNDLRAEAAAARRRPRADEPPRRAPVDVVIRRATSSDGPALAALSALDGARCPLGPALIAEVGGSPRAVLPLGRGRAFGDPFQPTRELVALLELRAAQIRDEERPHPHRRGLLAWASPAAYRRYV